MLSDVRFSKQQQHLAILPLYPVYYLTTTINVAVRPASVEFCKKLLFLTISLESSKGFMLVLL
jgi:hypothetical protein